MTEELFIKWEIFSPEEKDAIIAMREAGQYKHFADVIDTMTPEKEVEIQKLVDSIKPVEETFESEVRKEFLNKFPNGPQTPEEEKEMQKAIDEEEAKNKKQTKEKKKSILESLKKGRKKETKKSK